MENYNNENLSLATTEEILDCPKYQTFFGTRPAGLHENFKTKRDLIIQHDNNLKHKSNQDLKKIIHHKT